MASLTTACSLRSRTSTGLERHDAARRSAAIIPRRFGSVFGGALVTRRRHVRTFSRAQVLAYFEEFGATTKQRIAETIAKGILALDLYIPPPRKPWKSEDARMGIFEAAALAWILLRSRDL